MKQVHEMGKGTLRSILVAEGSLSKSGYEAKILGVKVLREAARRKIGVIDMLFSGILLLMILRYPGMMIRLQVVEFSHWRLWHIMYRASCTLLHYTWAMRLSCVQYLAHSFDFDKPVSDFCCNA